MAPALTPTRTCPIAGATAKGRTLTSIISFVLTIGLQLRRRKGGGAHQHIVGVFGVVFTGRVRFLLKERIPQYKGLTTIPLTIDVIGRAGNAASRGLIGTHQEVGRLHGGL